MTVLFPWGDGGTGQDAPADTSTTIQIVPADGATIADQLLNGSGMTPSPSAVKVGAIDEAGDVDVYWVSLVAGHTYHFSLSAGDVFSTDIDPRLDLYDASLNTIFSVSSDHVGGTGAEYLATFSWTPTESGIYYLGAMSNQLFESDDMSIGGYGVSVELVGTGIPTVPSIIAGTEGNDNLPGTAGDDTFYGKAGNDWIFGGLGDDTIFGGLGDDRAFGGAGGNDEVFGGAGNDVVGGGDGDDLVGGGSGNDILYLGEGQDAGYGGAGNDQVYAGSGNDSVYGGADDDIIYGGDGFDVLFGGDGNDTIFGGADDDQIWGGAGDDVLYGGAGLEHFNFGAGSGNDIVYFDPVEGDMLDLHGQTYTSEEVDGNLVLHLSGGGEVTLMGVDPFDLSDLWFV